MSSKDEIQRIVDAANASEGTGQDLKERSADIDRPRPEVYETFGRAATGLAKGITQLNLIYQQDKASQKIDEKTKVLEKQVADLDNMSDEDRLKTIQNLDKYTKELESDLGFMTPELRRSVLKPFSDYVTNTQNKLTKRETNNRRKKNFDRLQNNLQSVRNNISLHGMGPDKALLKETLTTFYKSNNHLMLNPDGSKNEDLRKEVNNLVYSEIIEGGLEYHLRHNNYEDAEKLLKLEQAKGNLKGETYDKYLNKVHKAKNHVTSFGEFKMTLSGFENGRLPMTALLNSAVKTKDPNLVQAVRTMNGQLNSENFIQFTDAGVQKILKPLDKTDPKMTSVRKSLREAIDRTQDFARRFPLATAREINPLRYSKLTIDDKVEKYNRVVEVEEALVLGQKLMTVTAADPTLLDAELASLKGEYGKHTGLLFSQISASLKANAGKKDIKARRSADILQSALLLGSKLPATAPQLLNANNAENGKIIDEGYDSPELFDIIDDFGESGEAIDNSLKVLASHRARAIHPDDREGDDDQAQSTRLKLTYQKELNSLATDFAKNYYDPTDAWWAFWRSKNDKGVNGSTFHFSRSELETHVNGRENGADFLNGLNPEQLREFNTVIHPESHEALLNDYRHIWAKRTESGVDVNIYAGTQQVLGIDGKPIAIPIKTIAEYGRNAFLMNPYNMRKTEDKPLTFNPKKMELRLAASMHRIRPGTTASKMANTYKTHKLFNVSHDTAKTIFKDDKKAAALSTLWMSMMQEESSGNPNAVGDKGASLGLFQFNTKAKENKQIANWKLKDPKVNFKAQELYTKKTIDSIKSISSKLGIQKDLTMRQVLVLAAAAHNGGNKMINPDSIRSVLNGGVIVYKKNPQTAKNVNNYIAKVLRTDNDMFKVSAAFPKLGRQSHDKQYLELLSAAGIDMSEINQILDQKAFK